MSTPAWFAAFITTAVIAAACATDSTIPLGDSTDGVVRGAAQAGDRGGQQAGDGIEERVGGGVLGGNVGSGLSAPAGGVLSPVVGLDVPVAWGFVAVSGGPDEGCGIRVGGGLQCWGEGPVPPPGEFVSVGVGAPSCGLGLDASLACWGLRPRSVMEEGVVWPPDGEVAALSSGDPLCALRPDGSLACSRAVWGEDDDPTPGGAFVAVSVGYDYVCGVRPSLALECWGSNLVQDLRGDVIAGYVDVGKARPPGGAFVAVSAGSGHACGIGVGGGVVCWGSNRHKQLVGIPEGRFAAVAASSESTCALGLDGAVVCWGGDSEEAERNAPGAGSWRSVQAAAGSAGCAPTGTSTAGGRTAGTGDIACGWRCRIRRSSRITARGPKRPTFLPTGACVCCPRRESMWR